MADTEKFGITEADALQLAEKLVAFEATLPPAERALLQALRQRAAGIDQHVEGYFFGFDPFLNILIDAIDGPDRGGRTNRGSAAAAWGKSAGTRVRVHGARPTYVAPPARPAGR